MNERDVAKEALKKEHVKEIVKKIAQEAFEKKLINNLEDINVDDKGKITFDITGNYSAHDVAILEDFIRHLIGELADTKAELWLQTQSVKKS